MDQQELKNILELHRKWVMNEGGSHANLCGADLGGVNLCGADLGGVNLRAADLGGVNLGGVNLCGADLGGVNLRAADLGGVNLRSANLGGANLGGVNLRSANLYSADLRGADLYNADLRGADLRGADLRGANLGGVNLGGVNLGGVNLRAADLGEIKKDVFAVLDKAASEVLGLLDSVELGLVDGTAYEGECACLVGTIANLRHENFEKLSIDLRPDSSRPAEKWFLGIEKGDTPQSNPVSRVTAEWLREWLAAKEIKFPRYEMRAVWDENGGDAKGE